MKGFYLKMQGFWRKSVEPDRQPLMARPRINDFFEKKEKRKKQIYNGRAEEQQRFRFGGLSFCHYKIAVMLQKCCKNQYETRAASVKGAQQ